MDSFFSLFDPSEGHEKQNKRNKDQENIKKNADAPKGRRRRRKSKVKNATLPEESSFLCEPDLSTEILVKDCSYIESYIALNKQEDIDIKNDPDRKPKRRNSGRKNRRRKAKVSPPKEFNQENEVLETLNNTIHLDRDKFSKIKLIQNDFKKEKRKENRDSVISDEEPKFAVLNVMDKLERVRIENDMYLAGDFSAEDLESDLFHGYGDEEYCDDDSVDADDSGDESYGNLPPEPRFGNVEYKLQLVQPCERRFQHLVTQLKWRLRSGGGNAVYVVGVRDCGALRGLRAKALRASLRALRDMARALGAEIVAARARRLTPSRAVAEVYIRKLADTQQSVELRVAVLGANEAGKSTLIGVLTQGELDNGRGSARLNMFRHVHEVKSGRTSSLSHEILGFDAQGNVVNYGCSELMTAERIGERSDKLVAFLDLAGHTKYQRTTLHGLTGYCPHYAVVVISATAGITKITEEHIGLLLALDLPFFAVINKCELAPTAINALVTHLAHILEPAHKKPLLITDENLARSCVAPQSSVLDTIDNEADEVKTNVESGVVAVFPVSCVRGAGLNALHACLLALASARDSGPPPGDESCEFQIDEIFHVGDSTGPVVGGLLARGQLLEGDHLIIGPLYTGEFVKIAVKTIYRNRVPCGSVRAGQSASLGLSHYPPNLRQGMVLLAVPDNYKSGEYEKPVFGECQGHCKVMSKTDKIIEKSKNRKNKNVLQDIGNSNRLIANSNIQNDVPNFDSDCECQDRVMLEDPNDPRGCIYFQARVRVLRHATAIGAGFQCSVHVGNVRQTAIIEGIMSNSSELRAGESAPVLFRFARCPEYLVRGRRLLFTAGLGTRAIGRVTQTFPYVP